MSAIHGELFTPEQPGEWIPVREAARRLGMSERAIRRRITRGDFLCRTHIDGRRELFLLDAEAGEPPEEADRRVDPERAIELVDRMSIAVTRQLDVMTVELAASRDRVEVLARENGVLSERVVGLERELGTARDALARQPVGDAAHAAGPPSAVEAELASVRRANQRQVEELARMAAELNAFKVAEDEAASRHGPGRPASSAASAGPAARRTGQAAAPWWSIWWIWVSIALGVACFLLLVRLVLG